MGAGVYGCCPVLLQSLVLTGGEAASKAHVLLSTAACPAGPARLRHGGAGAFCGALHDPRLDVKRMEATSLARTAETAFASLCR